MTEKLSLNIVNRQSIFVPQRASKRFVIERQETLRKMF